MAFGECRVYARFVSVAACRYTVRKRPERSRTVLPDGILFIQNREMPIQRQSGRPKRHFDARNGALLRSSRRSARLRTSPRERRMLPKAPDELAGTSSLKSARKRAVKRPGCSSVLAEEQ
jgi:hypothetical protein